ncbi:Probable lipoprotein precursor [Flavobacterium indicum GPTSA100-9 = DSM 17447]|uniref:Probable lipoprotein n=1 Tax=Flavobacterium indicum (strain DSM 17447 / CIP 109464 / GPTSA100-9) TaxID=1094466 RepID=H8XSV9_FLAIG|nr:hypothetical protein [Flavobacterium indicum]CCG53501.1 Probable lipoprotein precursor [Flavobacterium indicum GPTSA100-9 = DSM 17447]
MRNCFLIVVFLFLCLISCKSNYTRIGDKNANYLPYYLKINEADSLYIVGNYQRSFEILDSLFKKFEPINLEGYSEYKTYIRTSVASNNFNGLKKKVKKSFVNYGAVISNYEQDSILNIALKKTGFTRKDLDSFLEMHKKKINLTLRDTIEKMIEKDKSVRGKGYISDDKLREVNEENMALIKIIFDKYGYPSHSLIGYSLFNDKDIDLGAVFLHTSVKFKREYLLPKLKDYSQRGFCLPQIYAGVYDRLLLDETNFDGSQLYGEIKFKKLKLINESKVDSIRKSIGLPSLNYNKWRNEELFGDFYKKLNN